MRAPFFLAAWMGASCLQLGTGTGAGSGSGTDMGMGAGNARVSSLAANADGGPGGTNCFQDPATQTVLCEQIDACPGVDVDPGVFPDCGFHMLGGGSVDLECLCGTALCPIGVPASCVQAKALLDAQNALGVCGQQAEGRCVELVAPDSGTKGSCDPTCRDECAGAPSCIQLCGC